MYYTFMHVCVFVYVVCVCVHAGVCFVHMMSLHVCDVMFSECAIVHSKCNVTSTVHICMILMLWKIIIWYKFMYSTIEE